jgi:signal transduction histidine kinase
VSRLAIRWRMTVWYGAALCLILVLFSGATYLRYRSEAWKAFDIDLRNNLDTLQGEWLEEFGEAQRGDASGPASAPREGIYATAARRTLEDFRLNGLYAEIRRGASGQMLLARIPGAGLGPGEPLLTEATWKGAAESRKTRTLVLAGGRRAVVRGFQSPGEEETIALAVGDRTILVEETLASIRRALFELGTVGVLLAIVGGYLLAARALAPIDALTVQAGRMASAPMAGGPRRLDVPTADDEVGRLALTFNDLLERIESSMTQTRQFIADAAHELKTPISIVRAEAELALSGDRSRDDQRTALRAIADESARLSHLVRDVTLLAEGETLDLPLERRLVDLAELLHEVVASLRALAASREISVEVEATGSCELRGDERLLRKIATNLVENAVKFSPCRSRIGVAVFREQSHVELRVLDEAPTLSETEREKVFGRFYRSQTARSSGAAGSGLGLAIVRWAIRLHGGSIRVEPRAPEGNVFVAEFPLAGEP